MGGNREKHCVKAGAVQVKPGVEVAGEGPRARERISCEWVQVRGLSRPTTHPGRRHSKKSDRERKRQRVARARLRSALVVPFSGDFSRGARQKASAKLINCGLFLSDGKGNSLRQTGSSLVNENCSCLRHAFKPRIPAYAIITCLQNVYNRANTSMSHEDDVYDAMWEL